VGTTGISTGHFGWSGWLVMADYDITDRVHVFARYSWLNDPNWLITGIFERQREASVGFGYSPLRGVEFRAEYRHDWSTAVPDVDSFSIHVTFGF
jgi:hypothetical protein